jgi:hypothetical protein
MMFQKMLGVLQQKQQRLPATPIAERSKQHSQEGMPFSMHLASAGPTCQYELSTSKEQEKTFRRHQHSRTRMALATFDFVVMLLLCCCRRAAHFAHFGDAAADEETVHVGANNVSRDSHSFYPAPLMRA